MEQRKYRADLLPSPFLLVLIFLSLSGRSLVNAYQNYTVGDSLGWFDELEKPAVDYQNWTVGKTFSLGDFLIFNTDNNHSVVQTYNFTTYNLCDYDDASEDDTTEWSAADPSATTPHAVTVAVPLVKEGANYFFSGHYDGEQCQNGQHFKINVTHGQGLPKSLGDSSDEAPAPVVPDSGDRTESAPDTIVPSSFDNPRNDVADNDSDKKESSGSVSLMSLHFKFNEFFFLLVGTACIFLFTE
ncbi:cucumber peeling cupredoxin-like [Cucurbita maxima]|uniref:Cucumber peeling cupredoxin-like n=1 Tax=Cucurbita maxima TaxID=3661 RepID=A0A6J1JXY1_CUCMA|nr:cucumber peeling cupredoxin-like [Cucurbita maxima]